MDRILDYIGDPSELKFLNNQELAYLAAEIRNEMIDVCAKNGGHLAGSLGAVDLILALHSEMNSPKDKILFDVGHQSYAHKLITRRFADFATLRKEGGLSGFPNPHESEHDVYHSGHASDSLSIAAGLSEARRISNKNFNIAAVIGDASISGGMAFEALNIIGQTKEQILIVLNDNRMSISSNVGALNKHLLNFRTSKQYREVTKQIKHMLNHNSLILKNIWKLAHYAKEGLKYFALPESLIFEKLGIVCTPPIDGHDITALRSVFCEALKFNSPILVHVVTSKGKGYVPAEKNPELFHGVGPFNKETGELVSRKQVRIAPADVEHHSSLTFTQAFSMSLVKEAHENKDIVAITCAMKAGTGLTEFQKVFPDRFIDTGIAEENAVGMAAGLAIAGKKPVVAIYSSFLQRSIDQIIVDVALSNLDVVFCVDRAGLVGADGPTHHGAFDLVYLRMIPNMKIICPSCETELASALHTALKISGPVAIRYPRGIGVGYDMPKSIALTPDLEFGRAKIVYNFNNPQVCILAFGPLLNSAIKAAEILKAKGITVRIIDMCWLKPLDSNAVKLALSSRLLVTLEDGSIMGGAGSAVLEEIAKLDVPAHVMQLGLPDFFIKHGEQNKLFDKLGLSPKKIAQRIETRLLEN